MSGGVTFEALLNVDVSPLKVAAAAWDELARRIDERADALAAPVRQLPEVWQGGAGASAAARMAMLRRELDAAYVPVTSIGQALAGYADDLARLREQAHDLVDEGRRLHISIHPDGSMTTDPARQDQSTGQLLSSLVSLRDRLLSAASELDAQTTRRIKENAASVAGLSLARVERSSVPGTGTTPKQVKQWWDRLSSEQRRFVIGEYPELVGNLDGVPVDARDTANRIMLDREHDRLDEQQKELQGREDHIRSMWEQGLLWELYPNVADPATLAQVELKRLEQDRADVEGKLRGIESIDHRITNPEPGAPRAYLIGLSTQDDGRAIVSVGNPDEANNVLTYVPGTGSELSKTGKEIDRVDRMALDANRLDPQRQTAAIMWLGYDAPDDIHNAGSSSYADGAVGDLNRFQGGLRETHIGEASHNVVVGHSYGSTVIGHTAQQAGISADALIFVGAPGVGTNSAGDLNGPEPQRPGVPPERVWSTRAENDLIARIPDWDIIHGNDPTREDFGGRVFSSDPGDPDAEGKTHSAYWNENNVARRNISLIVTGRGGNVS